MYGEYLKHYKDSNDKYLEYRIKLFNIIEKQTRLLNNDLIKKDKKDIEYTDKAKLIKLCIDNSRGLSQVTVDTILSLAEILIGSQIENDSNSSRMSNKYYLAAIVPFKRGNGHNYSFKSVSIMVDFIQNRAIRKDGSIGNTLPTSSFKIWGRAGTPPEIMEYLDGFKGDVLKSTFDKYIKDYDEYIRLIEKFKPWEL